MLVIPTRLVIQEYVARSMFGNGADIVKEGTLMHACSKQTKATHSLDGSSTNDEFWSGFFRGDYSWLLPRIAERTEWRLTFINIWRD